MLLVSEPRTTPTLTISLAYKVNCFCWRYFGIIVGIKQFSHANQRLLSAMSRLLWLFRRYRNCLCLLLTFEAKKYIAMPFYLLELTGFSLHLRWSAGCKTDLQIWPHSLIIKEQICEFLNRFRMLSTCQSGFRFRKCHSTGAATLAVSNDLRQAIDSKLESLLVLNDFSKAFHSVNHDLLCKELKRRD